jgi:hypothetical protein
MTNAIYVFLLFGRRNNAEGGAFFVSIWDPLGIFCSVGLQVYSYFGILDQAANISSRKSNKELAGGQHLDWLALSLVIQFGGILHSTKWYWLLLLFPVVSGYSLYTSFFGGGKKNSDTAATPDTSQQGNDTSRREKRAEKRRTKRS